MRLIATGTRLDVDTRIVFWSGVDGTQETFDVSFSDDWVAGRTRTVHAWREDTPDLKYDFPIASDGSVTLGTLMSREGVVSLMITDGLRDTSILRLPVMTENQPAGGATEPATTLVLPKSAANSGTANTGGTFTLAASSIFSTNYDVWRVTTGGPGAWCTRSLSTGWVRITLSQPVKAWEILLQGRLNSPTEYPLTWEVWAGDSPATLTKILSGGSLNSALGVQTFPAHQTTAHTIYEFRMLTSQGRNPGLSVFNINALA